MLLTAFATAGGILLVLVALAFLAWIVFAMLSIKGILLEVSRSFTAVTQSLNQNTESNTKLLEACATMSRVITPAAVSIEQIGSGLRTHIDGIADQCRPLAGLLSGMIKIAETQVENIVSFQETVNSVGKTIMQFQDTMFSAEGKPGVENYDSEAADRQAEAEQLKRMGIDDEAPSRGRDDIWSRLGRAR